MKKVLSTMSAQEFVEHVGALGLTYKQAAPLLKKSQPSISNYATGKQPIPQEVVDELHGLIESKVSDLTARGHSIEAHSVVGSLIVYHNSHKTRTPHRTDGRFMRRQLPPDTRVYPAYRMTLERMKIYAEALVSWRDRVQELATQHSDEPRQRDYRLELADIKTLAESAPRQAPYDVLIERSQWDVVSRALRHLATTGGPDKYRAAHALRTHWAKHKGAGYPRHTALI